MDFFMKKDYSLNMRYSRSFIDLSYSFCQSHEEERIECQSAFRNRKIPFFCSSSSHIDLRLLDTPNIQAYFLRFIVMLCETV